MSETMGIYYFSGTGNSKYVAETVGDAFDNAVVIPISEVVDQVKTVKFNILGFIMPTYYLGVPEMVYRFIENIDIVECDYIFVIATKGWYKSGGAVKQMAKKLEAKGIALDYGTSIVMPFNDFDFGKVDSKDEQVKKLNASEMLLENIIKDLKLKENKVVKEPISLLTPIRHPKFLKKVKAFDQGFAYNDSCTSCGVCERVCPSKNITLHRGKPIWLHHCQSCLACYNHCPSKSITFNQENDEDTYYKHPKVKIL